MGLFYKRGMVFRGAHPASKNSSGMRLSYGVLFGNARLASKHLKWARGPFRRWVAFWKRPVGLQKQVRELILAFEMALNIFRKSGGFLGVPGWPPEVAPGDW